MKNMYIIYISITINNLSIINNSNNNKNNLHRSMSQFSNCPIWLHANVLLQTSERKKFILTPHTSNVQVLDSMRCPRLNLAPSSVSSLVLL